MKWLSSAMAVLITFALALTGNALAAQESTPDACTIELQPTGRPGQLRPQADWAWLCRYRAENDLLLAAGTRPQGVFIGDSITERWQRDDPEFFTHGRVGRGISGQTSAQILLRFHQDAVALKPRYIHLLVGTNDVAGNAGALDPANFRDNMRMLVALARQSRIRVFIGSIPPADRIYWREQANVVARIRSANEWLRAFAKREGVAFIDYYPALATDSGALRPEFTMDGVHPNAAGYAVMKQVAARHLLGRRYTSLLGNVRTVELVQRWCELAAFAPVMRSDEGNRPDENLQYDSSSYLLACFARLSRVHAHLAPYVRHLCGEASASGVPAQPPQFLHYCDDPAQWSVQDQFLHGADLLVAPVIEEEAVMREVILPGDHARRNIWSGADIAPGRHLVAAPLDRPPVFYRPDSAFAVLFAALPEVFGE